MYRIISEQNLIQHSILLDGFIIGKETGAQTATVDGCGCLWQFQPLRGTNSSALDWSLWWAGSISLSRLSWMWSHQVCAREVVASSIWAVTVLLPPAICSLPLLSAFQHFVIFHITYFFELDIKSCSEWIFYNVLSFVLLLFCPLIKYSCPFSNMTSLLETRRSKTKTLLLWGSGISGKSDKRRKWILNRWWRQNMINMGAMSRACHPSAE